MEYFKIILTMIIGFCIGSFFSKRCLNEAGVAIVPGTSFGNFAKEYVRFSFAASRENISKAIEKIDKILK